MRITLPLWYAKRKPKALTKQIPPILKIENGTFYREHPGSKIDGNPPLFPNLNFTVEPPSHEEYWAIVGPSNSGKTTFLEILLGNYICVPPLARSYPDQGHVRKKKLELQDSTRSVQYVGFNSKGPGLGAQDIKGAYLSARYESRREETDFSLLDYLTGNLQLNPYEMDIAYGRKIRRHKIVSRIVELLDLTQLLRLPVANLSNGQTRRARIAKALTVRPSLLLIDEPFLGLDPMTRKGLSPLLWSLSRRAGPRILISLQNHEEVPSWISHLLFIDQNHQIIAQGPKHSVWAQLKEDGRPVYVGYTGPHILGKEAEYFGENEDKSDETLSSLENTQSTDMDDILPEDLETAEPALDKKSTFIKGSSWINVEPLIRELHGMDSTQKEPLVEMEGVRIRYGGTRGRTILGSGKQLMDGEEKIGLWWTIRRGDRWGLFGPNGSGKTTLLSLISSDHPQAYSLPIKIFGRSRLPSPSQPGMSIFDIQARIGQSSPELYNFFPRNLTIRQTVENAWADTFLSRPLLTYENDKSVDAVLRWFSRELNPESKGPDSINALISKRSDESEKPNHSTQRLLDEYLGLDLEWADNVQFQDLSFSGQRVALFLRAIIKKPDIVILDEAFSGMDEYTRIKCMTFLAYGETKWLSPGESAIFKNRYPKSTIISRYGNSVLTGLEPRQALICISHRPEEVPTVVQKWICLPEATSRKSPRFGVTSFGSRKEWVQEGWWKDIWEL